MDDNANKLVIQQVECMSKYLQDEFDKYEKLWYEYYRASGIEQCLTQESANKAEEELVKNTKWFMDDRHLTLKLHYMTKMVLCQFKGLKFYVPELMKGFWYDKKNLKGCSKRLDEILKIICDKSKENSLN